ncbi:hypothetical protein DPMN_010149 [Dreissena polymorpha]|uniref:Uncharacterized protein n=1 Tax=Dreissena polymorpha TaxID=45954 RepID=A0A9D4N1J7_DREPO|nr:hypothetical protein DPMN_010149 [Dreissena polymorpha]
MCGNKNCHVTTNANDHGYFMDKTSIEDHLYAVRDDRINIICWKSPRIYPQSVTRTVRHAYLVPEQSLLILRSRTISLIMKRE